MDFLIVLDELFFVRCYGRGITSENRLTIGILQEGGSVSAKFLREIIYTRIDRQMNALQLGC